MTKRPRRRIEFEEILGKGNYFLEIQEHGLEAQQTNSQAAG